MALECQKIARKVAKNISKAKPKTIDGIWTRGGLFQAHSPCCF